TSGDVVVANRYAHIERLPSEQCELTSGDNKGLADNDGRLVFARRYSAVQDVDNGYVIVSRTGRCGQVTLNGVSTIPMIYDHIFYDAYGDRYFALNESAWEEIK